MPCLKFLRSDLNPSAQSGGTWTYVGYNATSQTGPWSGVPTPPLVQVPPGGTLNGDNPLVDPGSAAAGFYRFTYRITRPPCTESIRAITLEVRPRANSGNDFTSTICGDAASFSLQTLFNNNSGAPSVNGTITSSPALAIGSFPNYTLNPSAVSPGVYTLTRTVTTNPVSGSTVVCSDCTDTSTATLTIVPALSAGFPNSTPYLTVCNYNTAVNLQDLLNLESDGGDWFFVGAASGYPVYGPTTMTVNSNLLNNVTQAFGLNAKLSEDSRNVSVNLGPAAKGFVYRFRYIVNEGTACVRQSEVLIFASEQPLTGTATSNTICYQNLSPAANLPLFSFLSGANGSGSWGITTIPARPSKVAQYHNLGSIDPLNLQRGTDDTFNFQGFRNNAFDDIGNTRVSPGSAFDFTFTYTGQFAGVSFGCNPSSTTFTKRVVFTYNTGIRNPAFPDPFVLNCTNPSVNLATLLSGAEFGGHWHVAPASLAAQTATVTNLSVDGNPPQTYSPGTFLSQEFSSLLNFSAVPDGIYYFVYRGGTIWSGSNECPRNTVIAIQKSCCSITPGITNNSGSTVLTCNTTSISLTATGGNFYQWSHGPSTANVSITAPGTYTVTVSNTQGCSGTASITITENANPPNVVITPNPATSQLECNVSSITLTASGATTYNWLNGLGTNPVITVNTAGTYTVTGTGPNGCVDVESFIVTGSSPCPCNGQRGVFILRNDFGADINAGTAQITSFVVNGAQLITTPVNFNRIQNISQSYGNCKGCPPPSNLGTLHNAAATNALDALAIPCFDFEVPTIAEIQGTASNIPDGYSLCNPKYTKIRAPMCVNWSITVSTGANPYSGVSAASVVTWANVNGVVSVTGSASSLLGVNTFPNYSCSYFGGNNVIPLGTESIC